MKSSKHIFITLPILVSAVSLGAMSQSIASLYKAKTSWSVHSEAGMEYCSVSQGFSDKVYATFAKRRDGSLSLAVDFQKSMFQTQQTYAFKVKSGSVSRSFNLTPSTNNAVIFPLGEDPQLMEALVETSILSLDIEGEEHSFSLKNPLEMKNKLVSCVANLVPVSKEISITDNTKQAAKEKELETVKTENEKLNTLLRDQRRATDTKMASMTSDAKTEEAREKLFILEQENKQLKSEKESLSHLKKNLENVESLRTELQTVKEEKKILEETLVELKERILELEHTKESYKSKSEMNVLTLDSLTLDLSEKKSLLNTIQKERDSLLFDLSALKQTITQSEQGEMTKLTSLQEKDTQITNLQRQLKNALSSASELETALDLNKAEDARFETLQKEITTLNTDKNTLLQERDHLVSELGALNENIKESEKGNLLEAVSLQEKDVQIVSLQRQVKDSLVSISDLQNTLDFNKAEISRLEGNQGANLAEQTLTMEGVAEKEKTIVALEKENLEKQNKIEALLQEQEKDLEDNISPPVDLAQDAFVKDLEKKMEGKNSLIAALEREKQDLESQIKAQKADDKMAVSYQEEYNFLDRRYKSALVDLDAIKAQNIELEDQKDFLEKEMIALKASEKKIQLSADASWDLEKATYRYQEAQREIMSLGRLVEQKDLQCEGEKKDIEKLLFDPEIADREQRAKLSDLESIIADKDQTIALLESGRVAQHVNKVSPSASSSSVEIVPVSQPASSSYSGDYVRHLMSNIEISTDIQEQQKDGMKIYRWKQGDIHGTAIEKPATGQPLSDIVDLYINRTHSKCSGDFAAIPSLQTEHKQTYEIACVKPNGKGSSASLLFLKNEGNVITIAHEGRTEFMGRAIEIRDQISESVQN